jgi:hypothetical protein
VTHWDAGFHLHVRGELEMLGLFELAEPKIELVTSPGSPVWAREYSNLNGSTVKHGAPFEFHFQMIWGGTLIEGEGPPGQPVFILEIVDPKKACFKVRIRTEAIGGNSGGVTLDVGRVILTRDCEETDAATWVVRPN